MSYFSKNCVTLQYINFEAIFSMIFENLYTLIKTISRSAAFEPYDAHRSFFFRVERALEFLSNQASDVIELKKVVRL